MIRVRITQPTVARLPLGPGDELLLQRTTPELEALLAATRMDGQHVAVLEDEVAAISGDVETATTRRGRAVR